MITHKGNCPVIGTNVPQADSGDCVLLSTIYYRLLADVRCLSGVPLGAPDEISYAWLLNEAPRLDKQILGYLESNPGLDNPVQPEIPEWLKPLWEVFLSSQDGKYLKFLRDLLLFCYKAEFEPTHEQLNTAQAEFEETDRGVGVWDSSVNSELLRSPLLRTARQIVGAVTHRIDWREISPHHGPGSVFPTCPPDEKSRFSTYYPSIQRWYPYDKFLWCLPSFWDDIMVRESKGAIKEVDRIVAKLVAVPKDSRGPRLICVHPKEAIWIQQGQRQLLEDAISRSPLTGGRIKFKDQTLNSDMALVSSSSREYTTLDLSEASDRISSKLVEALFGSYTYEILSCSRASHIQLLDGRLMELRKWVPMGNALCFPVESLIFYAVVRAGIRCKYGVDCTDIYVFGDDLLFPSKYYEGAVYGLVASGAKPNVSKTFRRGFFRESCGVDAYRGKDVTPFRMRRAAIVSTQDALSLLDLAKRLRLAGYEHCASGIYGQVRRAGWELSLCDNPLAQGLFEYVKDWRTVLLYEPSLKIRRGVQQWSVSVRQVRSALLDVSNGDWYHLLDSLNSLSRKGEGISDRGTEYPIPYRTRLTYGWADCVFAQSAIK